MGSSWGQAGVKLGSSWGQAGVKLGSSWGQAGVKLGSRWGQGAAPYLEAALGAEAGGARVPPLAAQRAEHVHARRALPVA